MKNIDTAMRTLRTSIHERDKNKDRGLDHFLKQMENSELNAMRTHLQALEDANKEFEQVR